MFSSLFSLIIQLTVIFPWTGGAAAGSVRFPLTRPNLGFTALRRAASRNRRARTEKLKRQNMRRLQSDSLSTEVETGARGVFLHPWHQIWTGVVPALGCCSDGGCVNIFFWLKMMLQFCSHEYLKDNLQLDLLFSDPTCPKLTPYNCSSYRLFAQSAEWKSKPVSIGSCCYLWC